jgi:hypothetical protein
VEGILTPLSLLTPTFSLPRRPRLTSVAASHALGTLSYRAREPEGTHAPAASVTGLSPVTFSAPEHLTSELLRTLSRVAASKPTSWLSSHLDIVFHLAST